MILTRLQLQNFRNYRRLDLLFEPGRTLLYGPNGAGKTNVVEAIYTLATTKSFRARSDREMINKALDRTSIPYPFARLQGDATDGGGADTRVEIVISAPDSEEVIAGAARKQFRLNGSPKRAGDVVGQVKAVLFSPSDVDIVTGSPSGRRRYIDLMMCQVDRSYLRLLQSYARIVQQRNSALAPAHGSSFRPVVEILDEKLIEEGSQIILRRLDMIVALAQSAAGIYSEIAGSGEELCVSYAGTTLSQEEAVPYQDLEIEAVRAAFAEKLQEATRGFRDQRVTTVGPHRDDLSLELDGDPLMAYGSRGQQRSVSLALRMAEARYIRDRTGQEPILLLDEALSELDEQRREHLLEFVAQTPQVVLTGTSEAMLSEHFRDSARLLHVVGGSIESG